MKFFILFLIWFLFFSSGGFSQQDRNDVHESSGRLDPAAAIPKSDLDVEARKRQDFQSFDPRYFSSIVTRIGRYKTLSQQVMSHENFGNSTACSHQIIYEIGWLLSSTADFKRIDQRLNDLQDILLHPELEKRGGQQDSLDGSWGSCSTEWFFKVNSFFDQIQKEDGKQKTMEFKPIFLDRVNSPEKLNRYFDSISVSDILHSGVDHRRELNESLANLMRLILRNIPADYSYHPALKEVLMDQIEHHLRNPETGFWGERYIRRDSVLFVDDLSISFHVISYLGGKVTEFPKIIEHTLAVKDLNYPVGWLNKGKYLNHHNMDVATIFKLGWPLASADQQQAMAREIGKMLSWCLNQSLQADGSFKADEEDDSIEEATYYGASFLSRIGFFSHAQCFWDQRDFPGAEEIRNRIINNIEKHISSGGAGGTYYTSALAQLRQN